MVRHPARRTICRVSPHPIRNRVVANGVRVPARRGRTDRCHLAADLVARIRLALVRDGFPETTAGISGRLYPPKQGDLSAVLFSATCPGARRLLAMDRKPGSGSRERAFPEVSRSAGGSTSIELLLHVRGADASLLRRAIESVQNQTSPNWQLSIVADAALPWWTRRSLARAARKDPRIKVTLSASGEGPSAALNLALLETSARYVLRIEETEALAPEAIEACARQLTAEPACKILYSDEDAINRKGTASSHISSRALSRPSYFIPTITWAASWSMTPTRFEPRAVGKANLMARRITTQPEIDREFAASRDLARSFGALSSTAIAGGRRQHSTLESGRGRPARTRGAFRAPLGPGVGRNRPAQHVSRPLPDSLSRGRWPRLSSCSATGRSCFGAVWPRFSSGRPMTTLKCC